MALIFLTGGGIAHVDEEDEDAVKGFAWTSFDLRPSGKTTACVRLQRGHRRIEVFLHRLVAMRMSPDLQTRTFAVYPVDGDYLNCRRENLEVAVRSKKVRPGKPPGPRHSGYPFTPEIDALWANRKRRAPKRPAQRA